MSKNIRKIIIEEEDSKELEFIKMKDFKFDFPSRILLESGVPTFDMMSHGIPVVYTEKALKSFELDSDPIPLYQQHTGSDPNNYPTSLVVGYIDNIKYNTGKLLGDIHFLKDSEAGKHAAVIVNKGLMRGLSVEVITDEIFNTKEKRIDVNNIKLLGAAIVSKPACGNCYIN